MSGEISAGFSGRISAYISGHIHVGIFNEISREVPEKICGAISKEKQQKNFEEISGKFSESLEDYIRTFSKKVEKFPMIFLSEEEFPK